MSNDRAKQTNLHEKLELQSCSPVKDIQGILLNCNPDFSGNTDNNYINLMKYNYINLMKFLTDLFCFM